MLLQMTFSQEDALLKIYYGRYAEKFEPLPVAYLNTDNTGKIKKESCGQRPVIRTANITYTVMEKLLNLLIRI